MTQSNDRLDRLEARLTRLEGEFREEAGFLLDGLRALSAQTTNLANRIDQLTERVDQNTQAITVMIEENQRIWEYLMAQVRSQGNGHEE